MFAMQRCWRRLIQAKAMKERDIEQMIDMNSNVFDVLTFSARHLTTSILNSVVYYRISLLTPQLA